MSVPLSREAAEPYAWALHAAALRLAVVLGWSFVLAAGVADAFADELLAAEALRGTR